MGDYVVKLTGHERKLLARLPDGSNAEEVLKAVMDLMVGLGFTQTSIVRAMQKIEEESSLQTVYNTVKRSKIW